MLSVATPAATSANGSGDASELVQRHAAAQPWHNSQAHRFIRKLMILRLRRLYPALATSSSPATSPPPAAVAAQSGTRASLAQRLEWMLYHAAYSMEEYGNQRTLERRIRALATHIEPDGSALARITGVKRPIEQASSGVDKRQRREETGEVQATIQVPREDQTCSQSELFLGNDHCLVAHVMSFLDGMDVLRCRGVNRFMWTAAPSMVHTVRITARVPGLETLPAGHLSSLLCQCSNLVALTITNRCNNQVEPLPAKAVARSPSPTKQVTVASGPTSVLCSARRVLQEVASALRAGACASMEILALDAPMDHLVESAEVVRVVEALIAGREGLAAAKVKVAPLKRLVLDATFLGDKRIERIASLLQTGSGSKHNCFAAVESIVLSNNYIGAGGCRALMGVLPTLPALRRLDLGCNILTDLDAIALVDAFDGGASGDSDFQRGREGKRRGDDSSPARLQRLCLDDNFIELPGRVALRSAAGLKGCQVSTARPSAGSRSRSRKFGLGGMCR